MTEKQEDFSCEFPRLIEQVMMLGDICYSLKDDKKIEPEILLRGMGAHFHSIKNELRRINKGLYGSSI
jgi:hypothetical protein